MSIKLPRFEAEIWRFVSWPMSHSFSAAIISGFEHLGWSRTWLTETKRKTLKTRITKAKMMKRSVWSGASSVAHSTMAQKDLGSIPTQDGIFWKLSDNELKSIFCNIIVTCNIRCLLSQIHSWSRGGDSRPSSNPTVEAIFDTPFIWIKGWIKILTWNYLMCCNPANGRADNEEWFAYKKQFQVCKGNWELVIWPRTMKKTIKTWLTKAKQLPRVQ